MISDGITNEIDADTTLKFSISKGFRNPIDTGVKEGFVVYTAIKTGQKFYKVDISTTTI